MAVLPASKAKGLGAIMAKSGIGSSLGMKKSSEPSEDEESEDEDYGQSELESCASDLAEAISAGDTEAIKSAILDLADCIKQDYDDDDEVQLGDE